MPKCIPNIVLLRRQNQREMVEKQDSGKNRRDGEDYALGMIKRIECSDPSFPLA